MTRKRGAPNLAKTHCDASGLIPADTFWGRILPEPLIIDRHLPFEERVERAWRHIKATGFYEDEHERLREVLITTIDLEVLKEETK